MIAVREWAYEVNDRWEQLPAGLSHLDVTDVAVDSRDRVYLFTRQDFRVLVYESDGSYVGKWGDGVFSNSHGITIGPDDAVYCVDNGDHSVRKFTLDGELLMTLGTPGQPSDTGYDGRDVETVVRGAPPFNRCTNLAVAANGDLYVSDGYGNARVHHFSAEGKLLRSWGEPGVGPGQFYLPHGIWVAPDGRVLVADRENDRLQFFSPDGEYLDEWTDVQRPCAIKIDREGLVYVAELGVRPGRKSFVHGVATEERPGRVSIFDLSGTLVARWGDLDVCAPGNFVAPHGLCLDSRGDLYVAEVTWTIAGRHGLVPPDCHQIQKFTRKDR